MRLYAWPHASFHLGHAFVVANSKPRAVTVLKANWPDAAANLKPCELIEIGCCFDEDRRMPRR